MKIQKISLQNFKFHHDLSFEINKLNSVIYGENGTGKSSLYEALYVNFYYHKNTDIVQNKLDIREKYKHRGYAEDMKVNITFDDETTLNRLDNTLENSDLLKEQTIYFANERVLRKITEQNFYDAIKQVLVEHFPELKKLTTLYSKFKRELLDKEEKKTTSQLVDDRKELDKQFKDKIDELIPIEAINDILKNNFDEKNFEIEFIIKNSEIHFVNNEAKLVEPTITIKVKNIDDKGDLEAHFNEGRLKLISIAIYFALAKKYESQSDIKLLILDDFLTSLDMANRKLIIRYILDNFAEYQKIILTHNIQFFNLIIKLLKMRQENESWDIKNIFLTHRENRETAMMYSNENYLNKANDYLQKGELEISGNFLRKEYERIVNEFKIILELGKTEELKNIIESLINHDGSTYFQSPHATLNLIYNIVFTESKQTNDGKVEQIRNKFNKIGNIIFENTKEKKKNVKYNLGDMRNILRRTRFYYGVLMNPASHDDNNSEIYRKECQNSIELLKELSQILNSLKEPSFKDNK